MKSGRDLASETIGIVLAALFWVLIAMLVFLLIRAFEKGGIGLD